MQTFQPRCSRQRICWFYPMSRGQPAYFEISGPEIARIGSEPGASLALEGRQVSAPPAISNRSTP